MTDTVLEVARPNCVAEDFESEIVAMHLKTGTYFSMKDTAAVLWRDLASGHSVQSLLRLAEGKDDFFRSIERFVAEVLEADIMREARTAPAPQQPPELGPAIAAGAAEPVLEAFGDMRDLLMLDPVHEVDERLGWPVPAEAKDADRT